MDLVTLLAIVVVITVVAVGLLLMRGFSARDASPRDDLQRAGSARETTPYAASRRAEGDAAWTRISGGSF